jgi:hypothetical protein
MGNTQARNINIIKFGEVRKKDGLTVHLSKEVKKGKIVPVLNYLSTTP